MPVLDFTVRLSDIIVLGGGVVTLWKMAANRREAHRDIMKALGTRDVDEKRSGLLGDVQTLQEHDREIYPFVTNLQGQFQMRRKEDIGGLS